VSVTLSKEVNALVVVNAVSPTLLMMELELPLLILLSTTVVLAMVTEEDMEVEATNHAAQVSAMPSKEVNANAVMAAATVTPLVALAATLLPVAIPVALAP